MAQLNNAQLVSNLSSYFVKRGETIDTLAIDKSVIAGDGLTGGGVLTSDVTLNVGQGTGISVTADAVAHATGDNGDLHTNYAEHDQVETISAIWTFNQDPQIEANLDFIGTRYITSDSTNSYILKPGGNVLVDPTGDYVNPVNNYEINLGTLQKKYLTLHAAELWVETLVAQNTIATIGGRVLVGPTTKLANDLATDTYTIVVEHNQMAEGDIAYMEANGQVEFFLITSDPVASGDYWTHTVLRDLDGTGQNAWYAGDAMFNTGQPGDGFIDLYSVQGVNSGGYGPTITGNVRGALGPEKLLNTGFETPGLGGPDVFEDWGETAGGGTIADETSLVHGGSHAAKLTSGGSGTYVSQAIGVTAGNTFRLSFWTRGDGTYSGWYRIAGTTNPVQNPGFETAGGGDPDFFASWTENAGSGAIADETSLVNTGSHAAKLTTTFESVLNPGFETAGGGGADVFANWTESAGDGTITDEGSIVHGGSHAAKLTSGASSNTYVYQDIAITGGFDFTVSFWARGDGTYAGQYRIYDVTNAGDLVALTSTGVTGTSYTEVTDTFAVPGTCASLRIYFYCPATDTGIAYFDDVTLWADTYIYQDIALEGGYDYTVGFYTRGDGTYEGRYRIYDVTNAADLQAVVGTGISGTSYTQYTDTVTVPLTCASLRIYLYGPEDDTGIAYFDDLTLDAEVIPKTTTSVSGTSYTEVVDYFTVPTGYTSLSLYLYSTNQVAGITYYDDVSIVRFNYASWTEYWAIGNLNNIYGYATDTYGTAFGPYTKHHITIDETNGIRFLGSTGSVVRGQWNNDKITLGSTASYKYLDLSDDNGIRMYTDISSAAVKVFQVEPDGDVSFGSTASGSANMFWDVSSGRLKFRTGTTTNLYIDDSNGGLNIITDTAYAAERAVSWRSSGGTIVADLYATYDGGAGVLQEVTLRTKQVVDYGITYITGQGSAYGKVVLTAARSGGSCVLNIEHDPVDTGVNCTWSTKTIVSHLNLVCDTTGGGDLAHLSLTAGDIFAERDLKTKKALQVGVGADGIDILSATGVGYFDKAIFVGEISNSFVTNGVVINQGAADDQILALMSTDVTHYMTSYNDTNTYGHFNKAAANNGGLEIAGYTEAYPGLTLKSNATLGATAKSSSANGNMILNSSKYDGSTWVTSHGSNENLVTIQNAGTNVLIFDADGEVNGALTPANHYVDAWDEYDDIALLTGLRASVMPADHELRQRFGGWIEYAKPILEATKVVTYNDDGVHFLAHRKLQMLTIDAIRQLYQRIVDLEEEVSRLESNTS